MGVKISNPNQDAVGITLLFDTKEINPEIKPKEEDKDTSYKNTRYLDK